MTKANQAVSLGSSALVIIAIIIIVGFGLFLDSTFNITNSSSPTTTISNPESFPTSAETTNSTLGLELGLSANPTTLLQGSTINITVTILNVLPRVNNESAESDWAFPVLANFSATTFVCPRWENLLIFSGYYSESNISSGTPLWLSPPDVALACPFLNWQWYSFQPESLNVTVGSTGYTNYNLTTKALVEGYYTTAQGYVLSNKTLPPPSFPVGVYTIAAGDEWGQLVILHFAVSQQVEPTTDTISTTSSTSSNQMSNSTVIPSDVNASDACSAWVTYNNALGNGNEKNDNSFQALISNIESYPAFNALEGNRSGLYQYGGGGCGTGGLSLMFYYTDFSHPFTVCGNGTTWPQYQINVGVYLTSNGYDLSRSNFTSIYYGPTNTTVDCTTSTS